VANNKIATTDPERLSYLLKKAALLTEVTETPTAVRSRQADLDATDPDASYVARVLGGDVNAFEGIVRRWQGPLVNMAWRYCRDRGRAEEMAQEAFLRIWRGLASWRSESHFSTWLFSIAANVYRSELKRFPAAVPIDQAAEPSEEAVQFSNFELRGQNEALRRAVLTLPHNYREPVILYYFHEMDVSRAAQTMGLPEGTVKARLARARDLLRKRFPHLNPQAEPLPAAGKDLSR
jgi:RNA polymerase sigma-70 factor (ECF subfamily)